jgi:hypothetical protein
MADRYWVGGTGTWDATTTTNWATSTGGAGGASAPTSADNVIFDSLSNATLYTVTVGTNAVCADLTAAGPLVGNVTFSLAATARINCYGSFTLAATGITWTATSSSQLNFLATTTGKTVTTNGVSLTATTVIFNGVGGGWTLGSALTIVGVSFFITDGSFDSGNYNISANGLSSSNANVRSISLGSSTVTLVGSSGVVNTATTTNLTFNAGTSQITCSAASPTFIGGGLTFYNVSFTSGASGNSTITGANTFNDLSVTTRSADGSRRVTLGENQTVSGTLTLGATNTAVRRVQVQSDVVGTQRTITLNGTLATLADCDFRDIATAGTVGTWTGTRIGNALNNSGITFDSPKTVYWNLSGSQNWSAVAWATTNNGSPAVNNFPLPQDTATFTEAGDAGTVTIQTFWWIGSIQMADGVSNRTTAFTLATTTNNPVFYGNVTLFSSLTLTGTGIVTFSGQGTTQTITSAGVTFTQPITIDSPTGTVQLLDNFTSSNAGTAAFTLTSGTLDLNEFNLSIAGRFTSSNTNTRSIDFGSAGKILLTYAAGGAGLTILSTGDLTNFSYAGTSHIEVSGNNTAGTRTVSIGSIGALATEAQVMNVFVSAGSDTVSISSQARYKNLNFTGFSGTLGASSNTIYGNVILSSTMNTDFFAGTWTFAATSGTQEFTSNGVVLERSVTIDSPGAIFQLQDNLTTPSNAMLTLTSGTIDLSNGNRTFSVARFTSSNTNTRAINFGSGEINITENNAGVWTHTVATNFSFTGTPKVNFTYSGSTGTRTINTGTTDLNEFNALNFNVVAGSDTITFVGGVKNLDFTGFNGALNSSSRTIYGNLTFSSGMTVAAGTNNQIFAATSGIQQITSAGLILDIPITIDGVGGTFQLQDNMTVAVGRLFVLTNGTLDIDGKVLSVGNFSSSNSNTRVIDFGTSGELIVAGVGTTAFNAGTSTGLSITGTNAKISMSGSTAKTFAGGGFTYPLTLNQGGLGDLTITGANTFNDMTNTVQPCTIIFPASITNSFYNFNVNGTDGNLVLLRSSTTGTRYTLARLV